MKDNRSIVQIVREAYKSLDAIEDACVAFKILRTYHPAPIQRVPGMGTFERLLVRVVSGRTPTEAAAREYCYRFGLALDWPPSWNYAPHTLGL